MRIRLVEDIDSIGNELTPEQEAFFKHSKIRNSSGELLVVYRGTVSKSERKQFLGSIKWFTSSKAYANKYNLSSNSQTYECYLNCSKILDCGDTDGRIFNLNPIKISLTDNFKRILSKLNLTEQLFVNTFKQELKDRESYTWHIYTIVRTDKFADIVKRSGYDCIHTIEEGNNDCYGVLYDNEIKLVSNKKPTNSDNINESFKYILEDTSAPKKTGKAYKVFRVKNGKLYPPMVANAGGKDTPVGVWLEAEEGEFAGLSKTGRKQVKSTGSGTLSYRPGWHLGDVPRAPQFDRTNKGTGEKEFPKDFVWAECDYAMDIDYQPDADEQGYMRTKVDDEGNVITTRSDKYQHSLAGLPRLPKDGYYRYRTNPRPDTVPWVITGKMRVNKLLSDDEVNDILKSKGIEPIHRQGGDKTLQELGL